MEYIDESISKILIGFNGIVGELDGITGGIDGEFDEYWDMITWSLALNNFQGTSKF